MFKLKILKWTYPITHSAAPYLLCMESVVEYLFRYRQWNLRVINVLKNYYEVPRSSPAYPSLMILHSVLKFLENDQTSLAHTLYASRKNDTNEMKSICEEC